MISQRERVIMDNKKHISRYEYISESAFKPESYVSASRLDRLRINQDILYHNVLMLIRACEELFAGLDNQEKINAAQAGINDTQIEINNAITTK